VNVLAGVRVTDQGIVEGIAHELLRDRSLLDAERIRILADVNVKHSAPLGTVALEDGDRLGRTRERRWPDRVGLSNGQAR
jgi:predicted TIM-barrel enzyme